MSHPDEEDPPALETLRTLVGAAHDLAAQIAAAPLVDRILKAFSKLPEPDRDPILKVIERDATWCRIVEQTAETTGITVRPNPHASLYVHVYDQTDPPTEPLRRDIDIIRFGIERFAYLIPMLFQEGVHLQWTMSARELLGAADAEMRAYTARLAREVLAMVEQADREAGTAPGD